MIPSRPRGWFPCLRETGQGGRVQGDSPAKALAATLTAHNTQEKNLYGEGPITNEHLENNQSVRSMLLQRGVRPEELPPEEDIKKLERRLKAEEKKMPKGIKGWEKGE